MSVDDYWMGRDIDLDRLWSDFDNGQPYVTKVSSSRLHLLRLTFGGHPAHLPLFDHEVIYKTVKGTFHDVKKASFTPHKYDRTAPVFLYRVSRGSGIFEFLAQLDPAITWVVALGGAAMWYRSALAKDQQLDGDRLTFIRQHFPNADPNDTSAYLKAWTSFGRRKVLHRLIAQGLQKVELSPAAIDVGAPSSTPTVNMGEIVDVADA